MVIVLTVSAITPMDNRNVCAMLASSNFPMGCVLSQVYTQFLARIKTYCCFQLWISIIIVSIRVLYTNEFFVIGDAECVSGSCLNGECGIVDGEVTCTCIDGYVKDNNGICVKTCMHFMLPFFFDILRNCQVKM